MLIPTTLEALDELPGRLRHEVVVEDEPRPVLALHPAHVVAAVRRPPFVRDNSKELVVACVEIKFTARSSNRRVDLHAIDATPARWRDDASFPPLDGASAATPSPRNDLVKNRVHPTHWLISTQVVTLEVLI